MFVVLLSVLPLPRCDAQTLGLGEDLPELMHMEKAGQELGFCKPLTPCRPQQPLPPQAPSDPLRCPHLLPQC